LSQFSIMANAVARHKLREAHRNLMITATASQGDEKSIKKAARELNPQRPDFDIPDDMIQERSNDDVLKMIGEK